MPDIELSAEQLTSLGEYQTLRDAARNAVQHGLYPNAKAGIAAYSALAEALQADLSEWAATHAATTAAVAPYISQLISHAASIVQIVEAVAAADPRVFPAVSAQLSNE